MTSEFALLVFVTLLWGPTALWLLFRMLRYRNSRPSGSASPTPDPLATARLGAHEAEALVVADGFWVCRTCRSVNLQDAKRCYACRVARNAQPGEQLALAPVAGWRPVMDATSDRMNAEPAAAALVPSRSPEVVAVADTPTSREPSTPVRITEFPVPFRSEAPQPIVPSSTLEPMRAPASQVAATLTAAPGSSPTSRATPALVAAGDLTAMALTECPYLGLHDDPASRFDFPDMRNLCHSASEPSQNRPTAVTKLRRVLGGLGGGPAPVIVTAERQSTVCLTPSYRQCPRWIWATTDGAAGADAGPHLAAVDVSSVTDPAVPTSPSGPAPAVPPQPHLPIARSAAPRATSPTTKPAEGAPERRLGPTRQRSDLAHRSSEGGTGARVPAPKKHRSRKDGGSRP